jgi:hypothetical protein
MPQNKVAPRTKTTAYNAARFAIAFFVSETGSSTRGVHSRMRVTSDRRAACFREARHRDVADGQTPRSDPAYRCLLLRKANFKAGIAALRLELDERCKLRLGKHFATT